MFLLKQQLIKKSLICFSNIKAHTFNNKHDYNSPQLTYQAKYLKIDARLAPFPYKRRPKPSTPSQP